MAYPLGTRTSFRTLRLGGNPSVRSLDEAKRNPGLARTRHKAALSDHPMVQFRRNRVPGGTYFFTVTLRDRRSQALTDHIGPLREAFRAVRAARPFEIVAMVVLPEHLHAVIRLPDGDADYSGRWRAIKGQFSHALVKSGVSLEQDRRGEYRLWCRRFWEHSIRDDRDLETHVHYVHYNPVKHGWVTRVADWPWSSFHRYVRMGWADPNWAGDPRRFGDEGFGEP